MSNRGAGTAQRSLTPTTSASQRGYSFDRSRGADRSASQRGTPTWQGNSSSRRPAPESGSRSFQRTETPRNTAGPIRPSEWQRERQSQIQDRREQRRTETPRTNPTRQFPESYSRRPREPLGPAEVGWGYVFQHQTRRNGRYEGHGHYHHDGDWRDYSREHRHHAGCGHHHYDGKWHSWHKSHRHYDGCGHYYYGGSWYKFPPAHRHGPNCGHYYYDFAWYRFPRHHVHGRNCGHYYYDFAWHFWPRAHRHHAGCGHYFFNAFWYPFPASYYGYTEVVTVYDYGTTNYVGAGAIGPESLDHVDRGYERSRRGDYYGAIAAFSSAIASTPDNGPIYLALGLAYMQAGDLRSSYHRLVEGLRRTPDIAQGHPDLAGMIPDPARIDGSIDSIIRQIEARPDDFRALFVLGYLQFLLGDFEGAKTALQASAAFDPGNEQAQRLLNFIYDVESTQLM